MKNVIVKTDPGICGFKCIVKAGPAGKKSVKIEILESECTMVQKMTEMLHHISLTDLFIPLTKNPVIIAAEKAKCHPACPVPCAIFKAAEVALGMAVPKDVSLKIKKEEQE